jgi:glycine cleavage system H protein
VNVPENLRYTRDHEWALDKGDGTVAVGITDYAQDALGDITYLELPEVGSEVTGGQACGVVESVKTFSDLFAPLSGTIAEVNDGLMDNEALVNSSPYEDGWMFSLRVNDTSEIDTLLSADQYRAHLAESE